MIRGTGAETWDVPPSDEEYTLEEILAEYGSSRQQKILEEVDRELQPETAEEKPAPPAEPAGEEAPEAAPPKSAKALWAMRMAAAEQAREAEEAPEAVPEEEPEEPDKEPEEEPEESRFLSLEELVGTTVGAVMEKHREPLLKPKRGLFSRKRQQVDTEQSNP